MFITNLTAWNLEYIISIDSNRSQILRTNFEAQAVYIKIIINCSFITERTSFFHVIFPISVSGATIMFLLSFFSYSFLQVHNRKIQCFNDMRHDVYGRFFVRYLMVIIQRYFCFVFTR